MGVIQHLALKCIKYILKIVEKALIANGIFDDGVSKG